MSEMTASTKERRAEQVTAFVKDYSVTARQLPQRDEK